MDLKAMILASRRVAIGLCLAAAVPGLAVSSASAQQSDAAQAQQLAREKAVDQILAAEVPLGSDAWRAQKLAQSHRRHELVKIPGGSRTLQAFVVYPDTRDKVPTVLMVPEDQGLNNWARDMADQIAAMGYIVIVPDVFSGYGPNGGGRDSFPDTKSAMMVLPSVMKEDVLIADQNAWADYGKKLTQSNGKLAIVGFAWGGGRAFWFATQRKDLTAAFIFYDWSPPAQALAGVTAPVYGFYAEDDPRVTKTLEATKAAMAAAGKKYEPVIYPGSQHMFVRLGEEPGNSNPANIEARSLSLARLQALLKGM
jgi:carboxymethylenebutenolidase